MSMLSMAEQQDLRTIVEAFYGKHHTAGWQMNEELLSVVTEMLKESKVCSKAFDFVPRPGIYLSPNDVRKELQRMAKRVLQGGGANYLYCEIFVARNFRTSAESAGQVIP
jgi:hypothetical protein